jgi:hypothetical protein
MRITFKKTTRKEFAVFRKNFLVWQKRLGLTDWRVCFECGDPGSDAYASLWVDLPGRVATATLAKRIERETVIGWNPRGDGRHEALELLLISMVEQITQRKKPSRNLQEDIKHAVIRRLEHLFDKEGMK